MNISGEGIATTAIGIVADYCFDTLNIHKLTAGAYADNLASINAFINNGFIIEGQRKEHVLTPSGWSDVVLLGKLKFKKHDETPTQCRRFIVMS